MNHLPHLLHIQTLIPQDDCQEASQIHIFLHVLHQHVRENIRPSDILTKKAFENAVTLVVAMGGSTNTALHLPAIANEMGIKLTLKEIHDISMRTPLFNN